MQAYDVYKEGLNLLSLGDLQAAFSKVQTAASAVAIPPEYIDKANEIRADISAINEISDIVSMSGKIPPAMLADAKGKLERIRMKYGEIEQIRRLRTRLDLMIPAMIQNLLDNTQRLKQEAADAPTATIAKQKSLPPAKILTFCASLKPTMRKALTLKTKLAAWKLKSTQI